MDDKGVGTVQINDVWTFQIHGDGTVETTRVDPDTKEVVKFFIMPSELRSYVKVLQRAEAVATEHDRAMETWDPRNT
jgi:hypothetical protein